jgi:hypothetical protein
MCARSTSRVSSLGMPIDYRVVKALGCTVAVWDGDLTSEDMQQQMIRLASDPEWPPGPRHLVDASTLGTVVVPDSELLELLYEGTNLAEKIRIAMVVGPDFFDEARPRYPSAAAAFDAATFTDLDAACAYLGVSVSTVRATIEDLRRAFDRAAPA